MYGTNDRAHYENYIPIVSPDVIYYENKGERSRWLAIGAFITALGMLLAASGIGGVILILKFTDPINKWRILYIALASTTATMGYIAIVAGLALFIFKLCEREKTYYDRIEELLS